MTKREQSATSTSILPGDVPQQQKLSLLQALRCVAASLVVVDHSLRHAVDYGAVSQRWVHYADVAGAVGVYTFFVISGLIMYRTTSSRFGSPGYAVEFARRRLVRVVPLYWLATLAWVVVFPPYTTWSDHLSIDTVLSLLFVPYPLTGDAIGPVLGVGWSLNYEMFFYLLFTAALLLPRRVGLGALAATLLALVAAGEAGLDLVYASRLLLLFTAGIAIGIAEPYVVARARPLAARRTTRVTAAVAVTLLLVWTVPERDEGTLAWWVRFLVVPILLVLACTLVETKPGGQVLRLLERGGDASYSTYLSHSMVLSVTAKVYFVLDPVGGPISALGFVIVGLVAANLAGWLLYRWVEQPMTHRLNTWTRRRSPQPTAT